MSESETAGDYAWALMVGAGHAGCAGHEYDDSARRITCTCGVVLVDTPQAAEQAILDAIEGHQTYALTAPGDSGWMAVDEFAQCKCAACVVARAARIGFAECMRQRSEFYKGVAARRDGYERTRYAVLFPETDEVPF